MTTKYDESLMKTASVWGEMSYCKRAQVGAVLAKDGRVISTGFNGTPTGFKNECEQDDKTHWYTIHAEMNAILFAAKNGISTDGSTLYVTLSPCRECSKLILQAGIKRVIYKKEYYIKDGIDFLKLNGISVSQL